MYQSDNRNYQTKESMGKAFKNSCLGKLVIFFAFLLVILLIAYFTTPTEKEMRIEMGIFHPNPIFKPYFHSEKTSGALM